MSYNKLKADIKSMSEAQLELKNQRKTVFLVGERTLEPWRATIRHRSNRELLRHLFIIYGEMRGKTLDQIEPKRLTEPDPKLLDQLKLKYPVEETVI